MNSYIHLQANEIEIRFARGEKEKQLRNPLFERVMNILL
jgi:hypothetical protein